MSAVTLHALEKRYPDGYHAVRGVSLEIAAGEFLVLVGPSGCGKSTTLRMVAGLEEISGGTVRIGDRVVNDVAPGDRDIAMVFQNYALYPHLTVRDNMAFGLRMRRMPAVEIDRRVAAAAESLSISHLLGRRPRELSGGQRQRVALGRAIVREPAVFLFDEPLSNLDAKLRVQMRAEIAALHRQLSATVIYVTHDQVEAMTLGQRIALMNHGVVQQVDAPLAIYHRPANRFVASFIGSPTMNFFSGAVAEGSFQLAAGGPRLPLPGAPVPAGPAVLGIRPEDFATAAGGDTIPFATVTVDMAEQLGHETLAHFQMPGAAASAASIARLPGDAAVQAGDRVDFAVRRQALHVFAADDEGRRLN